jgi:hypothetical protein
VLVSPLAGVGDTDTTVGVPAGLGETTSVVLAGVRPVDETDSL